MTSFAADVSKRVLAHPGSRAVARTVSDWIDLQLSIMLEQLRAVAPRANGRLIDVGCGDKPYEAIFRPYVTEYIGVEHEASFNATHASRLERKPDVIYDGRTLPFEDESVDTVLSIQVLEHTPHPQHLLNEMARVLRKGGTMIISAPFSFRLHEEPHDFFRYTPHGLRLMCETAGLNVEEIQAQGGFGSVIGHKLNSLLAFRVAGIQGMAQALGKLGHEQKSDVQTRLWTLPVVFPAMGLISLAARLMDKNVSEPSEALSFLVIARRN